MKGNLLEEYMKQVEEEGLKNGIVFNESVPNSTSDIQLDESTYIQNLEKEAMLSDNMFEQLQDKLGVNWEHIQKVMEVSEKKYTHNTIANNPKYNELLEQLRKDGNKLC